MNGYLAGILTEVSPTEYVFRYDDGYFADSKMPAVSLTLPKTQQEYRSAYLRSRSFRHSAGDRPDGRCRSRYR